MIALILAFQLTVPEPECQMWWYTRLTWETSPSTWQTGPVGTMHSLRTDAVAARDEMLRTGFTSGPIMEDWSDLLHIAPGAIKAAPVRRVCCMTQGPIEDWWCVYPDGE